MLDLELFQFHGSHYNEKARWVLDYKQIPHRRTALLPGPHMPRMMKLTGQSQTPALRSDDGTIAGSANIIDHLEKEFPEPALYPADPAERARALELAREFDDQVGVAIRLVKFFETMEARVAVEAFGWDRGPVVRALYFATFPIVWQVMKKKVGISEPAAIRARERTRDALDFVAKGSEATGYLVGDRFTVADLTCAALLMPAVHTFEWGGPREAETPRMNAWFASWADHPGTEWVREMYRRHRSGSTRV